MINFAGGFNLPIWVAEREGLFAAEKISVKIDFTPGSTYQLTHLIAGTYDMGVTAIDNIIPSERVRTRRIFRREPTSTSLPSSLRTTVSCQSRHRRTSPRSRRSKVTQ